MDQLRIDPTFVFASAVGEENGIARAEIDTLSARAATKLTRPDPERMAQVEPILDFVASSHGRFRAVIVLADPARASVVRAIHTALVSPYADLSSALLPRLLVFDEADPDVVGEYLDVIDASECLFVVSARDGETAVPLAPFLIVREQVRAKLGDEAHKDHFVFAGMPPAGELREVARTQGYPVFADVGEGGLGTAALLASAMVGVDVKGILAGASDMDEACTATSWEANPALLFACVQDLFARRARRAVACAYGRRLRDLAACLQPITGNVDLCRPGDIEARLTETRGAWVSLLAVDEPDHKLVVPASGVHSKLASESLNALFVAERERARQQLAEHGCPNLTVHFPCVNAHAVGQFLALARTAGELRAAIAT